MVLPAELDGRRRVVIENAQPQVDCGRFPAKRVAGDIVVVEADIFADGHDLISAVVLHRHLPDGDPSAVRMLPLVNDRWRAEFPVAKLGFSGFTIEAWIDHFLTWQRDLRRRIEAEQPDLDVQLEIGAAMIERASHRAKGRDRKKLEAALRILTGDDPLEERLAEAQSGELIELMWRNAERLFAERLPSELLIEVDRPRAEFSSWYELFPRSLGKGHGTLRDVEQALPRIAKLGFDVLYLPPLHPIGTTFRKGKNNATTSNADDVGSPWAIGGPAGGHHAVHPELGTVDDVEHLVAAAAAHGLELAMDIAFQSSPDHPWVSEHPDWFLHRPDGTIQYAENPPKKYQDIYPFHFETEAWRELWTELCGVFRFWIGKGVRIFRVDNPHTKPLPFWEWCIRTIKADHPDVIFLAEAFTRPRIMLRLAKAGFSQSYTYFAWRNTQHELTEYFSEIARPPVSDLFRPNAWPNTPDILPEYLQHGGRPAFVIRLILAATLSASYGIYGPPFERMIGTPRESGSEEYLHSEKYQLQEWGDAADDLSELIAVVNRIRHDNRALQQNLTLKFHETDNDQLICFSKSAGDNVVVTIVNLDPGNPQSGWITLDLDALALDARRGFQVHDLLSGARHTWHGARNFVKLDPHVIPAHIFRIRRKVRTERDFDYFS